MKLFLVIYNAAGLVVGSVGPVQQTFAYCQQEAAKSTMVNLNQPKEKRLQFVCKYLNQRPIVEVYYGD